ncbi:argininosuccinate lyase [Mesorhizobium sp. B2-6-2]|uniref:argininosuccinate lyase n=1 Tax=Mesorhizobium sp. B2-6-2 TaxID=2589915 RepID=UPI0011273B5A|nr:argininosuccinate lyase [Mesorhizobium sp. B2-6-2]TPJ77154.1 argininosuccinate lyase [Mesorhizobium sp. B2-6-2]
MSVRGERLSQGMAAEVRELVYRPRLERETKHALEHMHAINQAHLLMLKRHGFLSKDIAAVLAREMLELQRQGAEALPNDPSLEDLYFNCETALIARTGVEIGGSLHVGRSRNDIGATIDRMRARREILDLIEAVSRVRSSLLDQAERHADTVMPGYTHLQPSQPVTFGFYLLGVATALARDIERLRAEYRRMNLCPLGAGAMAGTSFAIDRNMTAGLLAFDGVAEHSQDAVAARDYMLSLSAIGASLSTTWSRLAQDFYVWTTAEFALIDFADSVAGVSSIMPQKKNPVVIEALKANAGEVIGDYTAMLATMRASHFTHSIDATRASLNRAWTLFETCRSSMTLLDLLVAAVIPRARRMRELTANNFSTMTDLADFIVQRHGLSFREAHHIVGYVTRRALEEKIAASGITAEMVTEAVEIVLHRRIEFGATEISDILDPQKSVERRISLGAPCPAETLRMLAAQRMVLQQDEGFVTVVRQVLADKAAALKQAVEALASIVVEPAAATA